MIIRHLAPMAWVLAVAGAALGAATTQPASAAADLRAFRERLMRQAAELKRPEEGQVFIQRLLGEYGVRFSVSFTIEVDRRDADKFPAISTLYVWPEEVKNVEGLIEFVRRTLPEMEVVRDVEQPRVIHLIAKSLVKEERYAMGRRISIRYKGTPSGLLGELEGRSGGLVAVPRMGIIGEPMWDRRTKIEVDAADLPYRSVLSDWLPFAEYRPILWIAEARVVDGKLVAGVKFQGPREWPRDAWGPVTGGVRLGIIVDHAVWTNDRPIRISAVLQNMGQAKIDVPHMALMGMLQIELKLPDGKPAPLTLEGKRYEQMARLWANAAGGPLKPGETETMEVPLSRLFDMSLEGTYKVVVRRRIDANLTVSSAEVAIRVEDAER